MCYLEVIWVVLFLVVLFIFIKDAKHYYGNRGHILEIEKGESPVVQISCGGIFNMISYTYPFVKLQLYKDFLVIGYEGRIALRYEEIECMSLYKILLITYIKIVHHKEGLPANILLSTFSGKVIRKFLKDKVSLK